MTEQEKPWYIKHYSTRALGDHLMTVFPPAKYLHERGASEVSFPASNYCRDLVAPELPRAQILEASEERVLDPLRLVARKILPYPIVNFLRLRHDVRTLIEQRLLELQGYSVLNLVLLFRRRRQEIHRAHTLCQEDAPWQHRIGLSFEAFPLSLRPPEISRD